MTGNRADFMIYFYAWNCVNCVAAESFTGIDSDNVMRQEVIRWKKRF